MKKEEVKKVENVIENFNNKKRYYYQSEQELLDLCHYGSDFTNTKFIKDYMFIDYTNKVTNQLIRTVIINNEEKVVYAGNDINRLINLLTEDVIQYGYINLNAGYEFTENLRENNNN